MVFKYLVCENCQEEIEDSIVFTSGDVRNAIFNFNSILRHRLQIAESEEDMSYEYMILKTLHREYNEIFEEFK